MVQFQNFYGQEALDFLNKTGEFSEVQSPDLILLDINIPNKSKKNIASMILMIASEISKDY